MGKHFLLRVGALLMIGLAFTARQSPAQTEQTRESWQRVDDLIAAAGARSGASIADIGAGEGFLTVRLAKAVGPAGKVYAVDSDPKMTAGLRDRVSKAGLTNVETIDGQESDPHLPMAPLEGVIILNAYHEMANSAAMLGHIISALKPGGRLVVCEPIPSDPTQSRSQQIKDHVIDPQVVADDLRRAGFSIVDRQDRFATNLGGTHFGLIVATRP